MTDTPRSVWVISERTHDGEYVPAIHFDNDTTISLTRATAYRYASAVLAICHRAEYDAVVAHQMRKLGAPLEMVATVLKGLRESRRPVKVRDTDPLLLEPGVSAATGDPFIRVSWRRNGNALGQWTPDDARGHALQVMEVLEVAPLDAVYRRYLIDKVEVSEDVAAQMVDELATLRENR